MNDISLCQCECMILMDSNLSYFSVANAMNFQHLKQIHATLNYFSLKSVYSNGFEITRHCRNQEYLIFKVAIRASCHVKTDNASL